MDLQERVLAATFALVGRRRPLLIAANALVYAAVGAVLVYAVAPTAFDIVVVAVCLGLGTLYSAFRDASTRKRVKEVLASHLAFVRARHPEMELYVPMLDKTGSAILLKRSGLFIEHDALALEAFNHPVLAKAPKDAITVPDGPDFQLLSAAADSRLPLVVFHAQLMKNPYTFYLASDAELTAKILAFAPQERTE